MRARMIQSVVVVWIGIVVGSAPASADEISLTLADALAMARSDSPRLERLAAEERGAAAEVDAAEAARRLEVEVTGAYRRLSGVPELRIPDPSGAPRTIFPNIPDQLSGRVSASLPIYAGGSLRAGVEMATRGHEAASWDRRAAAGDLLLEVARAYWRLVEAEARRVVVEESLEAFEAHLVDARNRLRFGLAAPNEVLAVEVERDRAELRRIEAERARLVAEADLGRLLGLDGATRVVAVDPLEDPLDPVAETPRDALVDRALAARPEHAALRARLAAAEASTWVARGAKKPQVRASGGVDLARPNPRLLPLEDTFEDSWDVGVQVRFSLFDGGRRNASIARGEARVEAARAALAELERAIRFEVTVLDLERSAARAAVRVARTALRSARENVRVTADRFRAGVASSTDLLDAEVALLAAGFEESEALVRVRLAEAGLARALGEGGAP